MSSPAACAAQKGRNVCALILTRGEASHMTLTCDFLLACVGSRRPFAGVLRTGCGLAGGSEAVKPLAPRRGLQETAQESDSYPCPCCGHSVLDEVSGSDEICSACFWEDDGSSSAGPPWSGGANKVSVIEAQRNYQDFGACDEHSRRFVRPPAENEPLDPAWRPIDPTRDPSRTGRPRSAPMAPRPHSTLLVALHLLAPGPTPLCSII
ncbi:CPCC family cysteine-rich protein [Streptomyces sp. MAR4 CNX-425]|uniref:CPCC family cysteine-rich protein n=1 Tax=Streptomyces sp. MAR4 CNX-425 TaxID=3406343 RepID=UPI003B504215